MNVATKSAVSRFCPFNIHHSLFDIRYSIFDIAFPIGQSFVNGYAYSNQGLCWHQHIPQIVIAIESTGQRPSHLAVSEMGRTEEDLGERNRPAFRDN